MLARIDGDALYQLVVLVLLGGGSLLKSILEKKSKGSEAPGRERLGNRMADRIERGREDVRDRLSAFEEKQGTAPSDPWQQLMEMGAEAESAAQAAEEEELYLEEVLAEALSSKAAATPEVSLGGSSFETGVFDQGALSDIDWESGGRIREEIEDKVSMDLSAHVEADMSGGVRGDARANAIPSKKQPRARHSWRAAVIAAELLGAPLALRGPESQAPGLRRG
ncbi:MAG: hypothetical protein OSB14_05790 [Planctomycetota bacterium]|nr:hypothetical protein [Planctomycetota bacterium]